MNCTTVVSATFYKIVTRSKGGAISHSAPGALIVSDCLFDEVSTANGNRGGAAYCQTGPCSVEKSCFRRCESDILENDDGGNCIYALQSVFDAKQISVTLCAPEKDVVGDCPIIVKRDIQSNVLGSNFSKNYGNREHGDAFGEFFATGESVAQECIVESCKAHRFIFFRNGTVKNCNVLNNRFVYLIYDVYLLTNCFFYVNEISDGIIIGDCNIEKCYSNDKRIDNQTRATTFFKINNVIRISCFNPKYIKINEI